MLELRTQIEGAARFVRERWNSSPQVGIILGTGLGSFTDQIQAEAVLSYETIPHFPRATAMGHAGQLVCGSVAGVPVANSFLTRGAVEC